ncbi:MAG: hypothetical protein RL333_1348 [Pseudomonadota bacterium]
MAEQSHGFEVPNNHPALEDHFPGNPLVPGALILDQVLLGCEIFAMKPINDLALKEIKFKSPLRGGEKALVTYLDSPVGIRFKVWVEAREIASGIVVHQNLMSE